jgi:hypothetical protein
MVTRSVDDSDLVELGFEDQEIVPPALRDYWGEYLKSNATQ